MSTLTSGDQLKARIWENVVQKVAQIMLLLEAPPLKKNQE